MARNRKTETRGSRVIEFIQTFCRVPEGNLLGKMIVLDDFQKRFIVDVYDNPHITKRGDLSIARKNGKSALISGLGLAHLVGPEAVENSQIVSGARSKEQSAIIHKLMVKIINMDDDLKSHTKIIPSSKYIYGLPLNVEYRALSAEGKTAHGLSPILAILDETGQVRGPQDDFIDAIITAQGAYDNPLILNISTQAPSDADLLSIWLDDAVTSGDKQIVSHVYAAGKDDDIRLESTWRKGNPALGIFRSLDDVRSQAERAVRMPSFEATFRNLTLNQRVEAKSPFVSKSVWDQNNGEPGLVPEGAELFGGLDLSATTDLTAFVTIWEKDDRKVGIDVMVWTPEDTLTERAKRDRAPYGVWVDAGQMIATPGKTVDYDFVAHWIIDKIINEGRRYTRIGFDRWRIDVFKKALQRAGATQDIIDLFVPFGQGFHDMAPALDAVESDLLNGTMEHGGHPVLTACAANSVVVKDPADNRKLDKKRSTGRIDAMVALVIAKGVAIQGLEEEEEGDFDNFLDNPIIS